MSDAKSKNKMVRIASIVAQQITYESNQNFNEKKSYCQMS